MHVVIAGCGRVGSGLAKELVAQGFSVSIIDEDAESFYLLGDDFPGEFVEGRALDWDVLRHAGIAQADAFVACTDGDNTNLVCTQIAQKKFGVKCSVARVYDPYRAELYAAHGLRTFCPTKDVRQALYDAVMACGVSQGEPEYPRWREG
jgi:trk system potassium uptake protein TrkA